MATDSEDSLSQLKRSVEMNIDAEKWFEDWRAKDRQAILAANPTIDMLIRELQHYRLYYATHQACRKAGGFARAALFKSRNVYLADAITTIEETGQRPSKKRLSKWIEVDNPNQEFSDTALSEAIKIYRKKRSASKTPDKET